MAGRDSITMRALRLRYTTTTNLLGREQQSQLRCAGPGEAPPPPRTHRRRWQVAKRGVRWATGFPPSESPRNRKGGVAPPPKPERTSGHLWAIVGASVDGGPAPKLGSASSPQNAWAALAGGKAIFSLCCANATSRRAFRRGSRRALSRVLNKVIVLRGFLVVLDTTRDRLID